MKTFFMTTAILMLCMSTAQAQQNREQLDAATLEAFKAAVAQLSAAADSVRETAEVSIKDGKNVKKEPTTKP